MPHFIFKAKKPTGEFYESNFDAADRYELYKMIRQSGDELISVEEKKTHKKMHVSFALSSFFSKIKVIEKINFARSLGSMLTAGLALNRALTVIERQLSNKAFKAVLLDLSKEIDRGTTFADALAKYPKIFSSLFVSMVHAGEQSGSLADALKIIALQLESSHTLTRRVTGALIYPAIIVVIMIIIAVILFTFVVPTLLKTFTELHVALPFTTQIVLTISNIMQHQGIYVFILIALISFGLYAYSKKPSGKKMIDGIILKIPVIGALSREINTARTARTLASLIDAGVDVVQSVSITSTVVQNEYFREALTKVGEAIKKGDLMSRVFAQYTHLYPPFMTEMVGVGEESGKMNDMLLGVAHYYEDDVDQKTKDLSTVIEPVIMVVIAAGVGFFAVAMISPMYSLVNAI